MPKKVIILQGHPDRSEKHLCHALAEAYKEGAEASGFDVTVFNVSRLEFPILRSKREWEKEAIPDGLLLVQKAILEANHLVIFYPLWLGTMPALLKGFFEQVLRPDLNKSGKNNLLEWRRLLKGCSARIVVTMGMPAFFYRWFYRAHGLKVLERNILGFVGVGPIRASLVGLVDNLKQEGVDRWCGKLRRLGETAR